MLTCNKLSSMIWIYPNLILMRMIPLRFHDSVSHCSKLVSAKGESKPLIVHLAIEFRGCYLNSDSGS